jgi:hypothetical protein
VSGEWYGDGGGAAEEQRIARAMDLLERALATAAGEGRPPLEVAERQALERVEAARR